jgi:transcription-repair coupling factor (superfamily II helicase)
MGLIKLVQQKPQDWKVRPDNKVVVKGEWDRPEARLNAAERILTALAKVALAA